MASGRLAQLVERRSDKAKDVSSILTVATSSLYYRDSGLV